MYCLDYALRIYTDWINGDTEICIKEIEEGLSKNDLEEFGDLIPIIDVLCSLRATNQFEKLFELINDEKKRIYKYDEVSGFRKDGDIVDDFTVNLIEIAFKEEFPDE